MGLDNSGYLKFDVDIEMEPKTYNTSNSNLWTKVRRVFKDELAQMYRDMRATKFKEENLFNILIGEQIDQIPESLYNEDSERKYIRNPQYLHMLHGSRREHMRKWINERLLYLDSQFGYEKNTRESIIIRANKKGEVKLNIKTYSPMFVKVRWRNDDYSTEIKKVGRNEVVTFVGDLPVETDQEIAIYGAKHIKDIGDISHMKPSSLSLGNATRLTKLICKDSPNLQAIGGLGGVISTKAANGGLKNLQYIDLTGCSILGTVASSSGLDVSYCDNLKTLKLQGTNLKNITFNEKGGSLEEMYLPNSLTSLYLYSQHRLKKVEFPRYNGDTVMYIKGTYALGSQIVNLIINDCPNLVNFGANITDLRTDTIRNYRGTALDKQDKKFDISKEEYKQAFQLSCFGRLENVNITNSLLNYKYYNIHASPSLTNVSFNNMPNLKGLIFTGNKEYGWSGQDKDCNIERDSMFENITVDKCKNFDTIILQYSTWERTAFKFKDKFAWDLSHLPLKRFICNIALQNLKKIILPDTIEEFSHSKTTLISWGETASDGSLATYSTNMSPLETIVVKGHYTEDFTGIDLADIHLTNVSFGGLTQKVDIIQNVDCEAIEISPQMVSEHIASSNTTQPLHNIKINLNNYKGNSLARLYCGADLTKVNVTLDKQLTTEGMDYTSMFQKATNIKWKDVEDFIKKLPPGSKLDRTFKQCDIDRLEITHMISSATTTMNACFERMPNITQMNLEGADLSNVKIFNEILLNCPKLTLINLKNCTFDKATSFRSAFASNPELQQIIGAENLINENVSDVWTAFADDPKLKFDFVDGKPNWRFTQKSTVATHRYMSSCGTNVQLADDEEYVLDLSDCGKLRGDAGGMFERSGFTKIIAHIYGEGSQYQINTFARCPNLKEVQIVEDSRFINEISEFGAESTKLITVNMNNVDMSKVVKAKSIFYNSKNLTNLTFGKGLTVSVDFSTNKKLTKKSLMSIIENIGTAEIKTETNEQGEEVTLPLPVLTLSAESLALLSDSEQQIALKKNWVIARG